jgi:hypothetical protein
VGRAATVFATCLCGLASGLAAGFGATTVMLGSWLVVAVCEAAVPLSNTVDRTARAEGATRLDDILITRSPKSGNECRPRCGHRVTYPTSISEEMTDGGQLSAIEPRYACATCFDSLR